MEKIFFKFRRLPSTMLVLQKVVYLIRQIKITNLRLRLLCLAYRSPLFYYFSLAKLTSLVHPNRGYSRFLSNKEVRHGIKAFSRADFPTDA